MAQSRELEERHLAAPGSASLSVRWVQGFPKQSVHFVNDSTICYPSGNFVIFINIETRKKTALQCMNGIVGVVATNVPYEVVAFSDRKLKPLIYIYSFPELTRRTKLKGNVLLDYTLLSFSYCGTYLASYSSLPEFELAVWNWESSVILCKKSQLTVDVSQMTFNPMSWHQLCLSSPSSVTVWTIERSNEEYYLKAKSIKLPMEDGSFFNEKDLIFPSSMPKDLIYGPVLPLSAIAGLVDKEAETFRPKDDLYPLLHPTMHCWTPTSDLYVGCEEGHLLVINGESWKVTVLDKIEDRIPMDGRNYITPVTLAYQKGGVLASGIDGFVYSFIIKDPYYKVEDFLQVEEPVEHLMFSPSYKMLLIQTNKVGKDILQISTVSLLDSDIVEVMVLSIPPETRRSKLEIFTLPKMLPQVSVSIADERGRLKDELIHKFLYEIEHPLSSAVLDFRSKQVYGFCKEVPYICSYLLPAKDHSGICVLKPYQKVQCKHYGPGMLTLSPHGSWLISRAKCGTLCIRDIYTLFNSFLVTLLSYFKIQVLNMMEENETVDNIAKLEQQEFALDLEELERLHDESEEEIEKIRKDVEMHNLAKGYLAELIKEECWNSMAVKGRALKCFHVPCVVENFPMKERTDEELKKLKRVLQQKKIETECLKLRKETVEFQSAITLVKKHHEEEDEEEEDDVAVKDTNLPNYLLGSQSTDFGVHASFLSSQLELHSREEKINQIILLKDIIYKVKTAFNNEFDAAYKQKEFEIARVKERNIRIQEIILDLELKESIWQPELDDYEKPERNLVVENSEIIAQKHVNLWQKVKAGLVAAHEMEEGVLSQGSNTRRRALMDMMGGVLEVKKEDILRMVIPPPAFIVKPDAVWSEEEKKQFKDYEKKVKDLNEERDKYRKNQTSTAIQKAREDLDVYKEHYDNLLAEDKVLDRSFKKEFSEIPSHQVDMLYKLFRRRPRIPKPKVHSDTASIVPFGERPGSGKLNKDAFAQLMKTMDDMDNINNMPEGLDPSVWEHFCMTRRVKVENEQKVKQKAAGLVEMVTFLRRRVEEDEKVQEEIEKVFQELILLQEEKVKFQLNLTIQILLKQGQVELENFQLLLEYSDAILINKNIIEDLNSVIRTQGQKKVTSMMESKDIHKGIFQTEWEHKKMEMEMEDLNQKAWDIQMLFFSRERQKYLSEPNYETLINVQIGIMEQTIAVLDKTHKKNVENCKKLLKKLGKFSNQKDVANYTLSCNLREELVAVSERKDICNALGSKLTCEKIAKERYENIIQQQKLTNISKEQAEQILILQAEVERLRMKTFPALVPM
ncbi:PREDICTED: cilia- and flagella-associated protein 43 [Hipposideros armiger]|uniref:Cilia- and flagella-associated protein 43 n=1 Tax=Hipposideros armiger TaxID=186990 RepID=A0A8B7QU82_HIPAR|nr:PREDICTED: cilia- and flagella-associated protein 43 [Hipposideros armiger]